jgi:hypothetical protein
MARLRPLLSGALAIALQAASIAGAQALPCDPIALHDAAETARDNIVANLDGAAALDAWRTVFDAGGAIAWNTTEYNVDARSVFVFGFDRAALRVYRVGAFGGATGQAMDGCIDPAVAPEAVIPWSNVREIQSGNWVLWFRLKEPVTIRSDRGTRRAVKELKAYFHGAGGGDLTYYCNVEYEGRIPFWNIDVYRTENLRGIAVGPNDFQRRLQFILASTVDPGGHIALKRKGRGAGW